MHAAGLALIATVLATSPVPAAAQLQSGAPNVDGGVDVADLHDRRVTEFEVEQDAKSPNTREARLALAEFGHCIAAKQPREADKLLMLDFKTPAYRKRLADIAEANSLTCGNDRVRWSTMRTSTLLLAGDIAEGMLTGGTDSAAKRLVLAAAAAPAPSFSFTDRVAGCVARSVPDQVVALFATEPGSGAETSAIGALTMPAAMCAKAAQAKKPLSINPAGLRAMLATAAYRSVRAAEGAS